MVRGLWDGKGKVGYVLVDGEGDIKGWYTET